MLIKIVTTRLYLLKLLIRLLNLLIKKKESYWLPNKLKKYTVLRSVHVHKKSREQFQIKFYCYSFCVLKNDTPNVFNALKNFRPEGFLVLCRFDK